MLGMGGKKNKNAKAPPDRPAVLDLPFLREMTLGNRALAREVLQLFDVEAETVAAKLESRDRNDIRFWTHRMKGAAAGIGGRRVVQAAGEVETALRAGRSAESEIAELVHAIAELRSRVRAVLG